MDAFLFSGMNTYWHNKRAQFDLLLIRLALKVILPGASVHFRSTRKE